MRGEEGHGRVYKYIIKISDFISYISKREIIHYLKYFYFLNFSLWLLCNPFLPPDVLSSIPQVTVDLLSREIFSIIQNFFIKEIEGLVCFYHVLQVQMTTLSHYFSRDLVKNSSCFCFSFENILIWSSFLEGIFSGYRILI